MKNLKLIAKTMFFQHFDYEFSYIFLTRTHDNKARLSSYTLEKMKVRLELIRVQTQHEDNEPNNSLNFTRQSYFWIPIKIRYSISLQSIPTSVEVHLRVSSCVYIKMTIEIRTAHAKTYATTAVQHRQRMFVISVHSLNFRAWVLWLKIGQKSGMDSSFSVD